MPPPAKRTLTRVEREWADFPFQPLDDVFQLAGIDSEYDAMLLASGLAHAWITWYMAMAKPVRRRSIKILLDRLPLPEALQVATERRLAVDVAFVYRFLQSLTVSIVRSAWLQSTDTSDGDDDPPPTIDWDLWTGPGAG